MRLACADTDEFKHLLIDFLLGQSSEVIQSALQSSLVSEAGLSGAGTDARMRISSCFSWHEAKRNQERGLHSCEFAVAAGIDSSPYESQEINLVRHKFSGLII